MELPKCFLFFYTNRESKNKSKLFIGKYYLDKIVNEIGK